MITGLTTRQVNPHRTNLILTTDDRYENWSLRDLGFNFHVAYTQRYRNLVSYTDCAVSGTHQDDELYRTSFYQLPQLLVSRLYKDWSQEDRAKQGAADNILNLIRPNPTLCQWFRESRDILHTIKCIKVGDIPIIVAILKGWGYSPGQPIPDTDKWTETPLRTHQLQALALYITLGYVNNWGQMRTGKTPPTIIWAYMLYLKEKAFYCPDDLLNEQLRKIKGGRGIDFTLVVCPNSIKTIWLNEVGKFTSKAVQALSHVVAGTKKQKEAIWFAPSIFKIVNYETLRADIDVVKEVLEGKRYALVLDESHAIKNPSLQTRAVQALMMPGLAYRDTIGRRGTKKDRIVEFNNPPVSFAALSGTPVANKPQDIVRVVQLTSPGMLGKSYDDFCQRYTYRNGYDAVTGFRQGALEEVHNQMARISIRALRSDVNMDLGKVIQPMELAMSKTQVDVHKDLMNKLRADLMGWDGDFGAVQVSNFLTQLMKVQQVTAGFLYDGLKQVHWLDDKHNPKVKWLDDFIEQYIDDIGKLVIACKFVPIIRKLTNRYSLLGSTCVYGAVKPEERAERMQKFRTDPDCRIFVLNHKTAEGLDLNPCEFMVFMTRDFQLKTNMQCEDRITGYNQKAESTIIRLLCQNSIDTNLEVVLDKKMKWFDAVMGDEGKTTPEILEGGMSITKEDLFTLVG